MDRHPDERSAIVATPNQAEDACTLRRWAEPCVWTERMLAALENGVKGDVWFSLIDKVWRMRNLQASFEKVKVNGGGPGVDIPSISKICEIGVIRG